MIAFREAQQTIVQRRKTGEFTFEPLSRFEPELPLSRGLFRELSLELLAAIHERLNAAGIEHGYKPELGWLELPTNASGFGPIPRTQSARFTRVMLHPEMLLDQTTADRVPISTVVDQVLFISPEKLLEALQLPPQTSPAARAVAQRFAQDVSREVLDASAKKPEAPMMPQRTPLPGSAQMLRFGGVGGAPVVRPAFASKLAHEAHPGLVAAFARFEAARLASPNSLALTECDRTRPLVLSKSPAELVDSSAYLLDALERALTDAGVAHYRSENGWISIPAGAPGPLGAIADILTVGKSELVIHPGLLADQTFPTDEGPAFRRHAFVMGDALYISPRHVLAALAPVTPGTLLAHRKAEHDLAWSIFQDVRNANPPTVDPSFYFDPGAKLEVPFAGAAAVKLLDTTWQRLFEAAEIPVERFGAHATRIVPGEDSAYGAFAADLQARGGTAIFSAGLLWVTNANANLSLATLLLATSPIIQPPPRPGEAQSLDEPKLAPGKGEGHELVHVHSAYVCHTLGEYSPQSAWLLSTDPNRDVLKQFYRTGFCHDEKITATLDLLTDMEGLDQWARTLGSDTPKALREASQWLQRFDAVFAPSMIEASRVAAEQLRTEARALFEGSPATRWRESEYYSAASEKSPHFDFVMAHPKAPKRQALTWESPDGAFKVEATITGLYRKDALRADVVVSDHRTGRRMDIPFYAKDLVGWLYEASRQAGTSGSVEAADTNVRPSVAHMLDARFTAIAQDDRALETVYAQVSVASQAFRKAVKDKVRPHELRLLGCRLHESIQRLKPFVEDYLGRTNFDEPGADTLALPRPPELPHSPAAAPKLSV
ncbi:MAG: hypothetical protein AAF654_08790 [Myxococcota bacterium]